MIVSRPFAEDDKEALAASLAKDEYHKETGPEFFTQEGTVCSVFEDDAGPIMFVRGSSVLRIDVQFCDNCDVKRNMAAMLERIHPLAAQARANGFSEIVFNTSSPLLKKFCMRRLDFEEIEGDELRLYLR